MNFSKVTQEHIHLAVQDFNEKGFPNGFSHSSTYDVIIEGKKYPPKTIMAYASQRSTGQEPINDFKGGEGTPCFLVLNKNGYMIQKKDDIKSLLKQFLDQANTDNLSFGHYSKTFLGMELKVSFGKGNPAKIPWAGFLLGENTIQKGIYPVFLLFKEINYLILAYGISERKRKKFYDGACSIAKNFEKAVENIFKKLPPMSPGIKNGKRVNVIIKRSITFTLS